LGFKIDNSYFGSSNAQMHRFVAQCEPSMSWLPGRIRITVPIGTNDMLPVVVEDRLRAAR